MNRMRIVVTAVFMLFTLGCLNFEIQEIRMKLGGPDKPAVAAIEYVNFSSDENDSAGVVKDFEDLLEFWQGEEYVREEAEEGVVIRDRKVWIHQGKIMARETNIIENFDKLDDDDYWLSYKNGQWMKSYDEDEAKIIETNGKVQSAEGKITVVWPKDAKEIHIKLRMNGLPESFHKNQPVMLKMLKEHLAKKAENE